MSPSEPNFGNLRPLPDKKETIAVAVQQTDGRTQTPKVIAGGRGGVAQQILEIAFQNGIKVREDADLAELLATVDVGSEIPLDAFAAVAEILTYVYQINNAMAPEADASQETTDTERIDAQELMESWGKPMSTNK